MLLFKSSLLNDYLCIGILRKPIQQEDNNGPSDTLANDWKMDESLLIPRNLFRLRYKARTRFQRETRRLYCIRYGIDIYFLSSKSLVEISHIYTGLRFLNLELASGTGCPSFIKNPISCERPADCLGSDSHSLDEA